MAHEHDHLPGVQIERDVIHGPGLGLAVAKRLGQVPTLEDQPVRLVFLRH